MNKRLWLVYAVATTLLWGIWGAFISLPTENGFPETLVFCVWALTMIPPAIFALKTVGWRLQYDKRSIWYGAIIGFSGAGGQMVLFYALQVGPAYLIFPIISLSPVITIFLSFLFLKERTKLLGAIGIVCALISLPLFEYSGSAQSDDLGVLWFVLAITVFVAWGVQAYYLKLANRTMQAESIFFYMTITGLMLTPLALWMTDFSQEINWGADGPYLAAGIQILNSIGVLTLVYAFRFGKAIVVSPLINAGAPIITSVVAMSLLNMVPPPLKITGIVLAIIAAFLLALDGEE